MSVPQHSISQPLTLVQAYADAVSIVGLHYPSDYSDYTLCHSLGKPVWASEESSSYDDLNGAACWARVITSHWVLSGFTSSIMWYGCMLEVPSTCTTWTVFSHLVARSLSIYKFRCSWL